MTNHDCSIGNEKNSSGKPCRHGFNWTGREDKEDGELGERVHHVITNCEVENLANNNADVCLLGFECDAGVKRNKGRIGAKSAPDSIRTALASMAWHQDRTLVDLGNVPCHRDELEQSQFECATVIATALHHAPVITLGGGHEVAWASFQGLAQRLSQQEQPPVIGIINFDAHFDLRAFSSDEHETVMPSSGTPFYQIADYCHNKGWPFHYACLGVSPASNTRALFQRADELNVWYIEDHQFLADKAAKQLQQLKKFITQCDFIYLTIDLDVFPAATAPGVSAPAGRGVSYHAIEPFIQTILLQQDKLILADIAEYNPNYDLDNQTARLAARLCWDIANSLSNSDAIKNIDR